MACGIWIDPPEPLTTMREVPAVNVPKEVSIDLTVIGLPFALRAPPLATINEVALIARLEPDVDRVVVPVPPWIVMLFAARPRAAIVKATVDAPLSKITVLNSLPFRPVPAKVIVWSDVALKVIVPDPADQEAEVEAFVQLPETVQASDPNAM